MLVHYRIGGTASNGVDSAALSGTATIPAGERTTRLLVMPIDDALTERMETVELGLMSSPAGIPPTYQIGTPSRGAAVIVDNDRQRPNSALLPDGMFHLQAEGADGNWFRIEASNNLNDWFEVDTAQVSEGALHFVDPAAQGSAWRFYRLLPALSPEIQ